MTKDKEFREKLDEIQNESRLRKSKFNAILAMGAGILLVSLGMFTISGQDPAKVAFIAIGIMLIAGAITEYSTTRYFIKTNRWSYSPVVSIKKTRRQKFMGI